MPITRQDIATQLSTLDGITGLATPPRSPGPGQGWPEWQQTTPSTMTGDEITWAVHVALPNGSPDSTVMESDALVGALMDALYDLGEIQTVQPTTLVLQQGGAQGLPCITVTLTTV
jgi:hypothetical protein